MKRKTLEYTPLRNVIPKTLMDPFFEWLQDLDECPFDTGGNYVHKLMTPDTLKRFYRDFLEDSGREDSEGVIFKLNSLKEGSLIDFDFTSGPEMIDDLQGFGGKRIVDAKKVCCGDDMNEGIQIDFADGTFCIISPVYGPSSDYLSFVLKNELTVGELKDIE